MAGNLPDHIYESRVRLIDALRIRGPLTTEEAAAAMLGVERVPAGIAGSVLDVVVRGEGRIRQATDGRWEWSESPNLLFDVDFVVIDVETTGGRPPADRITELGAVRVRGGRIADEFVTLVNPEREIPWDITRLTGITNEMVANQPTALEVFPRFAEWLGDAIVVAHNAQFDRFFIDSHWTEVFGEPTRNTWLCSVRIARKLYPALRSRSLGPLCGALGIPFDRLHRAGIDARLTAYVLLRELDDLAARGVTDFAGLLALVSPTVLRSKRKTRYESVEAPSQEEEEDATP